jgi:hypothetical protein
MGLVFLISVPLNHDLINKTATKEQLLAEAEEIKKFYRSITPEEVTTIRSFLSSNVHRFHLHRYHPFLNRRSEHTLSIDVLLKILQESRAIKSRNVFQRLISKLSRTYKYKRGQLSIFELWVFGLP